MKKLLRTHVASLFLLAPCAAVTLAFPATAVAQNAVAEVRSVHVRSDAGLEPGARLTIRVVGTPGARAVVRLAGLRERIELREVTRGTYVGRYVIKRSDRIEDDAEVRAVLRMGNRSSAANYSLAEVMNAAPPVAVVPPPPPPPPPVPPLRIERFSLAPFDRPEPGTELRFSLQGFPGATVVIDLPGVANDVGLREVRPGQYEGTYTLRRADNLDMSRPIVATLRHADRTATANLVPQAQSPADNRPPVIVNLTPREGEVIGGGPATQISAAFDDRGSGVDPASIRLTLNGRTITQDAQISATGFTYRANLAPGRYTVDVTASDRAGNAVRRNWGFEVGVAATVNLPLQITSHGNNAQVGGGAVVVQGRSAPFASLSVNVDGVAPVPGGFSVAQNLLSQQLQADGNGNFSFSFSPRFQIPGARYDVAITAAKANAAAETKLVLYQR